MEKRLHSHEPSKETSLLAARVVLEGSSHRKVKKAVHVSIFLCLDGKNLICNSGQATILIFHYHFNISFIISDYIGE